MARALSAGPALHLSREADYRAIEKHYRDVLDRTLPPDDLQWEPVKIGPTWQWTEGGWLLPEASLGWGFLSWTTYWLTGKGGKPWMWTPEQARFLLHYYSIDQLGDPLYHAAMLQRLKGWGKDPTAAGISTGSLHAPVIFDRWEGDRPIGRDDHEAWTQIAAVSQEQTKNTMKLFPALIPEETRKHYGIQIGKLNVWSDGDRRQIEAITSSSDAVEGGRPHQIIRAETQNWTASNGGHEMVSAMEGNAAKAEVGSPARILDIFNAFRPGRDSVAERARQGWEESQGDDAIREEYGVLWDSLEAPPNAPLTSKAAPEVVRSIAGDATWLDTRPNGRIVKSILNPENSPSESRRKWYNQITGTEDAWADPRWVDDKRNARPDLALIDGDRVLLFGDGSKSDDATGLLAVRMSDGFGQVVHYQLPEKGALVNRNEVDLAVDEAMDRFQVHGFFFDPSHAKADDAIEDDRFWWPLVDRWHERYGAKLKLHAVKSGPRKHAIAFDMLQPGPQMLFQPSVSQTAEDLENGEALHDGSTRLRLHMKNARRREGRYGVSMGKEHRMSSRKVDLAVCYVGARMMWRMARLGEQTKTRTGRSYIR
jgi:hypothetical protein